MYELRGAHKSHEAIVKQVDALFQSVDKDYSGRLSFAGECGCMNAYGYLYLCVHVPCIAGIMPQQWLQRQLARARDALSSRGNYYVRFLRNGVHACAYHERRFDLLAIEMPL